MVNSLENIDKSKVYADRVQGLSSVAISGSYNDLSDKPTIPTDSDLVHKTGNETISGLKSFSGGLHRKSSSMVLDTNPSSEISNQIWFKDKNDAYYATCETYQESDGLIGIGLSVKARSTNQYSNIGIQQNVDGTSRTYAPTPANSSNTTAIATTAYVNNKHQVVSTLPASPDSDVFYYIPE